MPTRKIFPRSNHVRNGRKARDAWIVSKTIKSSFLSEKWQTTRAFVPKGEHIGEMKRKRGKDVAVCREARKLQSKSNVAGN